jgi:hypothetical protein
MRFGMFKHGRQSRGLGGQQFFLVIAFQVGYCPLEKLRVVAKSTKPVVAWVAEKSPNFAGFVAMIHAQVFPACSTWFLRTADRAATFLLGK